MRFTMLPGNGSSFETGHLTGPMGGVTEGGFVLKFVGSGETVLIEGTEADEETLVNLQTKITEVLHGRILTSELTDEEIVERMEDGVVTALIRDSLNHLTAGRLTNHPFNAVAVASVVGTRNLDAVEDAKVEVVGAHDGDVLLVVRVHMKP